MNFKLKGDVSNRTRVLCFQHKHYQVEMRGKAMRITDPDGYMEDIGYEEARVRLYRNPAEFAAAYIEQMSKSQERMDL